MCCFEQTVSHNRRTCTAFFRMRSRVPAEHVRQCEAFRAVPTRVGPLAGMDRSRVRLKSAVLRQTLLAVLADLRAYTVVKSHMSCQCSALGECLGAYGAEKGLLACVGPRMDCLCWRLPKRHAAFGATKRFLTRMNFQVLSELFFVGECALACRARKWSLSSMTS